MTDADQLHVWRYLAGTLTEEERAIFEERVLTDPALQQEIALTHAMREGIRELAKRGELPALMSEEHSFWGRPIFGIAASVAAIIFATASILLYMRAENSAKDFYAVNSLAPTTSREVLRFELTRSASSTSDVTWRRPSVSALLELEFDGGIEPAPIYSVALDRITVDGATSFVVIPHLAPANDGLVSFEIHSALLPTGDYQIRLSGSSSDEPFGRRFIYHLRVACREQVPKC